MARFDRGWCSIPREWYLPDPSVNPFYYNPGDREILVLLIMWAVRKDTAICKRGEVLFAERQVAKTLGMGRRKVQCGLERLKNQGQLRGRDGAKAGPTKGPKATVVSIVDYDLFTTKPEEAGPTKGPKWGQSGARPGPVLDKGPQTQDKTHTHTVCAQIKDIWHEETAGKLPSAHEADLSMLAAHADKRSIEAWRVVFQKAASSPFLTGGGASGWRAPLAWILENAGRVLDGEFDRGQGGPVIPILKPKDPVDAERGSSRDWNDLTSTGEPRPRRSSGYDFSGLRQQLLEKSLRRNAPK